MVAILHLLQIKLLLVLVRDCDIGADEGLLIVVEKLSKGGEVLVTIPFCVVSVIDVIEVFEYLKGGDVMVCHKAMLQVQIVLFVKGVT